MAHWDQRLLPVTSRGRACVAPENAATAVLRGLQHLAVSLAVDGSNSSSPSQAGADCSVYVFVGIDSDDATLLQHQERVVALFTAVGVAARVCVFSEADRTGAVGPGAVGPGAVCQLWGLLASTAEQEGYNLAVLLGDDTGVQPAGWPNLVLSTFQADPQLMLLLLKDAADPGFPSCPVLRADLHMKLFGQRLLPPDFVNQGDDPYLAALYRRWQGCVAMLPEVTVINTIGGVQRADQPSYTPPRYDRRSVSKEMMLQLLRSGTGHLQHCWQQVQPAGAKLLQCCPPGAVNGAVSSDGPRNQPGVAAADSKAPGSDRSPQGAGATGSSGNSQCGALTGCAAMEAAPAGLSSGSGSSSTVRGLPACVSGWKRQLAVDVLVPTARVDVELLQGIVDATLLKPPPPGCDISLVLIVDQPRAALSPDQVLWLQQLQARCMHRVRVRINEANLGASAARNRALQESLAEYCILWDDDIKPSPGCLAAYVAAFQQHPQALGFAGPAYIPKQPSDLWCCAVHNADVLFFWDAAEDWRVAEVMPWAVTANLAVVNTPSEFDLRFPQTGGGEDIDFCLRVTGGRMLPMPQAAVHHPLRNNGSRCYSRFFGWAYGDGALIPMYLSLCYWAAPCSAEACCALLLPAAVAAAGSILLGAAGQAGRLLAAWFGPVETTDSSLAAGSSLPVVWVFVPGLLGAVGAAAASLWRLGVVLTAAALAYKLVDVVLDVARASTPERTVKHPCSSWYLRAAAATEASLIKNWSEVGRLCGLAARGELRPGVLCRRFDWFGGLSEQVVAAEQRRAGWRFLLCAAAAGVAVAGMMRVCE